MDMSCLCGPKRPLIPTAFFLLFFTCSCFIFVSCESADNQTSEAEDTVNVGTNSAFQDSSHLKNLDTKLDVLYLTEAEFLALREGNNRKIVFEFFLYDPTNGSLTLTAYPSQNHDIEGDTISLHFAKKSELDIAGNKVVFSTQKLPSPSVSNIRRQLRNTNDNEVVAFFPDRDGVTFHIYYNIYVFPDVPTLKTAANTFARIADTNPSPPASSSPDREN